MRARSLPPGPATQLFRLQPGKAEASWASASWASASCSLMTGWAGVTQMTQQSHRERPGEQVLPQSCVGSMQVVEPLPELMQEGEKYTRGVSGGASFEVFTTRVCAPPPPSSLSPEGHELILPASSRYAAEDSHTLSSSLQ